jgi:hypothetical protein
MFWEDSLEITNRTAETLFLVKASTGEFLLELVEALL